MSNWTFLTNHAAVLALVASHPLITAAAIAASVGIAERSVRRIISDLAVEGYLTARREGRTNRYEVNAEVPLRRPEMRDTAVGNLLRVLRGTRPTRRAK